ncbi:MAG: putative hydrolase [Acidimicrobiales bacterium]|nr:putative hydrolase [Acidimicrobiales bacterium]
MTHDLVIVGGTVVDGTGGAAYRADVAVDDGVITAVGTVSAPGRQRIDASGATVMPGFVDIHTHYDGQATWADLLVPSSWHGVTTVVMGNCGVGFAPVRPHDRQRLIELMEGVEDIPGAALHEGLQWNWESFPDYLDALDGRPHDIDIAAQVPHSALRLYVMGERGATRDAATAEEIVEMGRLARAAIEAGALGFTTSRTKNHRTSRGEYTPTLTAAADELAGIADALGGGVLEVVSDFAHADEELATVIGMADASGRSLSISITQVDARPDGWRYLLDAITAANQRGLTVTAQVAARPVGLLLGLQTSVNPLGGSATARALGVLPIDAQLAELRRDDVRRTVLAEMAEARQLFGYDRMFVLADPPDYEPPPEDSVAALAARSGRTEAELVYDHVLGDDGRAMLYVPFLNYSDGSLDAAREMLEHPHSVLGLGDGGAHVGTICDASFPTTMLTHWVRDRTRGPLLDLASVVANQTSRTAAAVGLLDRGVIAPGMRADINVVDLENLRLHRPSVAYDLPAGGRRFLQRADGYLHTIVAGVPTYANGVHTGALPGRLVRGARPAPTSTSSQNGAS